MSCIVFNSSHWSSVNCTVLSTLYCILLYRIVLYCIALKCCVYPVILFSYLILSSRFPSWIQGSQASNQLVSLLASSILLLTMHLSFSLPVTVDVIKTRYLSDSKSIYKSPMSCIAATYREAGVQGFFKVSLYLTLSRSPYRSSAFSLIGHLESSSFRLMLIITEF